MQLVTSFYRRILDAIPVPVFLVDGDLRVHRINKAATDLRWLFPDVMLEQGGCEILHCLKSHEQIGCGHQDTCTNCVVRRSAVETLGLKESQRQQLRFEATHSGKKHEMRVVITAVPVPEDDRLVLMIVENVSEVTFLKPLLPICMYCKKIRDDQEDWHRVENYIHRHTGVNFSHGVCPECEKELYRDIA